MKSTYSEMKKRSVEWIGEIPEQWETKYLFQIVSQVKCKNINGQETNLLSLSYGKIKRKNIETTEGLLPASFKGYNIVEPGDIVLRLTDLQNDHTSLRVGKVRERGIITSAYVTLRPFQGESQYLYYALHAYDLKKGFYGMGAGVRQGLTFTEAKMIEIPFPAMEIQLAIADYLDEKCGAIDEIIEQAKATIEEYKAWKSSVIFEAVTKGLDPNVEMKDSGVEWIGQVPKHWDILKFKYLVKIKSGDAIHNELLTDDGLYPVYGGGERIGYTNNYNVGQNAILVGRVGARCGCVTKVLDKAWATDNALVITTTSNYEYLHYLFLAANLNSLNTSNAQPLITATKINNHFVSYTQSPEEQKMIVDYLERKCSAIDEIIAEKEALIADMDAYKKSLIFETVTGKRKVC